MVEKGVSFGLNLLHTTSPHELLPIILKLYSYFLFLLLLRLFPFVQNVIQITLFKHFIPILVDTLIRGKTLG